MRLLYFLLWLPALVAADPYAAQRDRMVREQIQERGVREKDVLRAMRETPRHLFVPPLWRSQAYEDHPLPLGHGQTISQPYIVAVMTELLDTQKSHRVLEIGTGSGYQAAVLSPLVAELYTIEIVPELADSAQKLLTRLGYQNVHVRKGDGYLGWPEKAPFDRIILTAAPPEVPKTLLDQLKPGGKLVAPEGRTSFTQDLVVIDKDARGRIRRREIFRYALCPW